MKRKEIRTINDMYLVSDMLKFKTEKAISHSLNDSGEYPFEGMTLYGPCDKPTIKLAKISEKNLVDCPEILELDGTIMTKIEVDLLPNTTYTLSFESNAEANGVNAIYIEGYSEDGETVSGLNGVVAIVGEPKTFSLSGHVTKIGFAAETSQVEEISNLMIVEGEYEPFRMEEKELVVPYELGEGDKLTLKDGVVKITTSEGVITDITDTEFGKNLLALKPYCPRTRISCEANIEFEYRADTQSAYNNLLNLINEAIS